MHEKEMALLAKILPHMVARWRLPADLETLAGLPDGAILIDALAGTARHEAAGEVELHIARELRAGLESGLEKKGIVRGALTEATVRLATDTSKVKTDRRRIVHFDFRISSLLRTADGSFEASQEEDHVWHSREAGP